LTQLTGKRATMAVLFRIIMMIVAYVLACLAASLVLTLGTLAPEWNDLAQLSLSPELRSIALWSVVAVGTAAIFAVAMLPTLLLVALTEGFGLRSAVVYGALGGVLALAMSYGLDFAGYVGGPGGEVGRERQVLAAAGIAGGLVYWLVAGRKAGAWGKPGAVQ
jgi:hypothetical protein